MGGRYGLWMNVLMAANGLLFVAAFLMVGFHSRPSADDFHYLALTRQLGPWDAMVFYYQNWNPRWASTLAITLLLDNWRDGFTLRLMNALTVLFGWVGPMLLLHALRNRGKVPLSAFQVVVLPLFFMAGLFYLSFGRGDTWYWLCAVPMYLWGVFAVGIGFGLLLLKGGKWWRIPLVGLLFLYVGGSSEPVAVCTLILLFYLGFLRGKKSGRMFHVATVACLIGFGLDAMGSGIQVRMEHLPHLTLTERLWIGLKNYGRLLFFIVPSKLPALLAFTLPIAWMGLRETNGPNTVTDLYVRNRHVFAVADLMAIGISFMMALLMSEQGPDRAWLPISVMLLVAGIVVAYRSGNWLNGKLKGRLVYAALVAQLLLMGWQINALFSQVPKAKTYARAVDKRMRHIEEAISNGDTFLELQPLPDAGWLHSAEITADTAHHRNRHLSLQFGEGIRLFVSDSIISGE